MRLRLSASPADAAALQRMNADVDTRAILPSIRVPTLIVHRAGDQNVDVKNARYAAEHIPGARYMELPGVDHLPWVGDRAAITDAFREFLEEAVASRALRGGGAGAHPDHGPLHGHRRLDGSGRRARRHRVAAACSSSTTRLSAGELDRFRGSEIDTAGDGFFASFDGPARAIRCARAIQDAVDEIGVEIRAGLHTGECELLDAKVTGIAVAIGARVAAQAGPGRSVRLADGQGSRRRLGNRVRRPRRRRAQGRARRVAAIRRPVGVAPRGSEPRRGRPAGGLPGRSASRSRRRGGGEGRPSPRRARSGSRRTR